MEMPTHRTWMYNRLLPGRKGYTVEFLQGVEEFIDFACQQPNYLNEGVIKCPCKLCKNARRRTPNEVNVHIRQKGFTPGYWYWTSHGEEVPQTNLDVDMNLDSMSGSGQQDMGFEDADMDDQHFVPNAEVPPNVEATEYYDILDSTQQPLRPGYKNTSNLSAAITMLSLQSKHNMSQACINDVVKFMREVSHVENVLPSTFKETKRAMQPTKILRKKRYAETRAPLIIPSDTLQAYTNQTTQPPPRTKPRSKLNRPRSQPQPIQPQPRLQFRPQSQLRLQPQPTQSQPQLTLPPPRSRPQPTSPPPQSRPQPTPPPPRSRTQPTLPPARTRSRRQPTSLPPQSQPQPTPPPPRSRPPSNKSQTVPTQVLNWREFPMVNETPSSSSSHVSGESNGNKIPILPEGDG